MLITYQILKKDVWHITRYKVARLIAAWDDCSIDVGTQCNLFVQAPLDPTKENMKYHQDCIDPMVRTQASRIHMSDVPGIVTRKPELTWLVPSWLQSCKIKGQI